MRKERSLQNVIIIVLAVAILAMSIGFAAYQQTLNINGTATFTAATWDVHFDTSTWKETSTVKSTSHETGNTLVTYNVTLPKPGSSYSFEIKAKNYGTIDAKLVKINMTGLTADQQKYITHTVNYAGTDYTATTDGLNIALPAGTDSTATITVTVNYEWPENQADLSLISEDQTVNLSVSFDYEDARS